MLTAFANIDARLSADGMFIEHAHLRTFYDLCVGWTQMNLSLVKGPE